MKEPEHKHHDIPRLLFVEDVERLTGLNNLTLWRMEKEGLFPMRRKMGKRRVCWLESDIAAWVDSLPRADELGAG